MSVKSLQFLAAEVIEIAQIMKAESVEKEVISRIFVEIWQGIDHRNGNTTGSNLFLRTLGAAKNHPCKMEKFVVWHGNWKYDRNGYKVEREPLRFKNRSLCRCDCGKKGHLCECRCAAIIKMAAEFKMRSNYFDRKKPLAKFRINPRLRISDLLQG